MDMIPVQGRVCRPHIERRQISSDRAEKVIHEPAVISVKILHPWGGIVRPEVARHIEYSPHSALSAQDDSRPTHGGDIVETADPTRRNHRNGTRRLLFLRDVDSALKCSLFTDRRGYPASLHTQPSTGLL